MSEAAIGGNQNYAFCIFHFKFMKLIMPSRVSRRLNERFFFKVERDMTPKSAMARRPYPPGAHGKSRRRRAASEFGVELTEKQKVRYAYGISNAALKRTVARATRIAGRSKTKTQAMFELLERRLDNAVYRLGLAPSRRIARQVVGHGHIIVNERRVQAASRLVRPGDRIAIRSSSRANPTFEGLAIRLKKHQPPAWLSVDPEAVSGSVARLPTEADSPSSYNLSKVIEFYSR